MKTAGIFLLLMTSLLVMPLDSPQASAANTAQPTLGQLASQVKDACKSDLDRFCKGVTPGGGRVAACLDSRSDQLSKPCAKTWSDAQANISRRLDQAELAFRKDCGSDVHKYCSDVPSGKGRLLSCLDEHRDQISDSCRGFQAKLDDRLSQFLG